jgi:hypothetical protein
MQKTANAIEAVGLPSPTVAVNDLSEPEPVGNGSPLPPFEVEEWS